MNKTLFILLAFLLASGCALNKRSEEQPPVDNQTNPYPQSEQMPSSPEFNAAAEGNIDKVETKSPSKVMVYGWAYDGGRDIDIKLTFDHNFTSNKVTVDSKTDTENFTIYDRPDVNGYLSKKFGLSSPQASAFSYNAAGGTLPFGHYRLTQAQFNGKQMSFDFSTTGGNFEFDIVKVPPPIEGVVEGQINSHFLKGWSFYSNDVYARSIFTFSDGSKDFIVDTQKIAVGFQYQISNRPDVADYLVKKYNIPRPGYIQGFTIDLNSILPNGTYTIVSTDIQPRFLDTKIYPFHKPFSVPKGLNGPYVVTNSTAVPEDP